MRGVTFAVLRVPVSQLGPVYVWTRGVVGGHALCCVVQCSPPFLDGNPASQALTTTFDAVCIPVADDVVAAFCTWLAYVPYCAHACVPSNNGTAFVSDWHI